MMMSRQAATLFGAGGSRPLSRYQATLMGTASFMISEG